MKTMDEQELKLVLQLISTGQEMSLATTRPDGFPQATILNYASRGLVLFAAIGLDSQKAHNIQTDSRVSLTILPPGRSGAPVQALSIGAIATFVTGEEEVSSTAKLLLQRYPHFQHALSGTEGHPWGGVVFLRLDPQVISLLDYTKGYGHTDLFDARQLPPVPQGPQRSARS